MATVNQYYQDVLENLRENPKRWCITGVAGFIGSHLLEQLLRNGQIVYGIDNFLTGSKSNLEEVMKSVGEQWKNFQFVEADICQREICDEVSQNSQVILHQAALGSVPRSVKQPLDSHKNNVTGFLNMLDAARTNNVERFVFASSSAVYGDDPSAKKSESTIGAAVSPYGATKQIGEIYAKTYARCYDLNYIGLRYFNVFGKRQNPHGAYAAVIPKWVSLLLKNRDIEIYGDGTISRDFCYIENVVQANILAATTTNQDAIKSVYNVSCGESTSLNSLFTKISTILYESKQIAHIPTPLYLNPRLGDIRHSLASISHACNLLGYFPTHLIDDGLRILLSPLYTRSISPN